MKKITFYPFSDSTQHFAPEPQPASKFLPEWYKKMPSQINSEEAIVFGQVNTTIKKCMPVFDMITAGYIISSPCGIYLDSTNESKLSWSIPITLRSYQGDMFASHSREQYSLLPLNEKEYHRDLLRIFPFWAVGTESGYSAWFRQPAYGDDSPLLALEAIVDTDRFVSDGHLSFMVKKNFKGVIKQGTPLVQIIPFKRESWEMNIASPENASNVFSKQRLNVRSTFMNAYKNKFRDKKEYK